MTNGIACVAAITLNSVPALQALAPTVRWHHDPWCAMPETLDPDVAEAANLIFLADRMDGLRARLLTGGQPDGIGQVMDAVRAEHGRLFKGEFVEMAEQFASRAAFWLSLEADSVELALDAIVPPHDPQPLEWSELRCFALLLANIIDAKNAVATSRSVRVAALARHLAVLAGLRPQRCDEVELAGLLHDFGRIREPGGRKGGQGRAAAKR